MNEMILKNSFNYLKKKEKYDKKFKKILMNSSDGVLIMRKNS